MAKRISTYSSGVAGEYFVAAELSRRGFIASLTQKNTQGIDILASNQSGSRTVAIQVKTSQDSGKEWVLDQKAEGQADPNLFYVLVRLNGPSGNPAYHIVESSTVASYCRENHRLWLSGRKKDGTARKDISMRMFHDRDCAFEGAWDRLGLGES